MIRTQEMVPDNYIEKSRDFQILCRLYDFTLNSLKYNIDSMQSLTATRAVKDTVLPLLGDKFGIYDKEAYSNRQMLEAYPIALKHKGSLKSVSILLNAFLDSMNVFSSALALHSKDEESAAEISAILKREIKPYTLVIVLSTFPSLTNLHVLDEYISRVIPTGLVVEYMFGVNKVILDQFKYKEYVFLFYTKGDPYGGDSLLPSVNLYPNEALYPKDGVNYPYISFVKNTSDHYSATFDYQGTDNIIVGTATLKPEESSRTITWIPPHIVVNKPGDPYSLTWWEYDSDNKLIGEAHAIQDPKTSYTFNLSVNAAKIVVEYYWNQSKEFIDDIISDIDVNAVGLATIGGPVING